jgi:CheY-like chemotaxis protein
MGARIIVVDDNRWVRETLPALLDDEGYRVEVAVDGEDAFKRICREAVDLVLTDVSMPDVDGIELIRLMRTDPFFRSVPIVAMTAYGGRRMEDARAAGADACFEKPLQHEVLLTTIDGLLKRSRAAVAPR